LAQAQSRTFSHPKQPWDGDSIAPRCITTSGGQNYHPRGYRDFTNDEYAALQGFPPGHKFGIGMKKQVGNAFAPSIAAVLFTAAQKALEKADGIQGQDRSGSSVATVIEID